MEHEQQSDLYDPEHHHEHEIDATVEVSYEASHESHDAHEDPQDYPQPQPQQTYPQRFQPRSPAPPPRRAPPSLPAQQAQSQYPNHAYPNQQPRAYQPQPNPQYYPQPGYAPAPAPAYPVQAPPQNYQTQTNPQGYAKPHQHHSPYNPNAGAPGGYQNGGYGGAAQGVQMQGKPDPGYMAPQPQYQMSSYGNNPGTVGWSTGLFDCMDDPTNAVVTCFCPCFTFGQIAEIVDSGQTTCGTSGILYGVILALIGAPCILSCTYRSKMRTQYDLLEVPAADWLTHCFCECCALSQEYRELKNRGLDPALGWHGNMMLKNMQQQQPQVDMAPPVNQTMAGPNMAR